jgi:TRAP-type C4-dicarboxylate transport system permease small subunit
MGNPILQAIDIATKITRWLAILAAVCMAVLMIVNFTDVIGTKFFLRSVPGALDISEELMVFLTLLPLAFIALERGHIRIILLEGRMTPVVRFVLQIIQYVIAVLITGFITWRVFVQFQKTVKFMQLKEGLACVACKSGDRDCIRFFNTGMDVASDKNIGCWRRAISCFFAVSAVIYQFKRSPAEN